MWGHIISEPVSRDTSVDGEDSWSWCQRSLKTSDYGFIWYSCSQHWCQVLSVPFPYCYVSFSWSWDKEEILWCLYWASCHLYTIICYSVDGLVGDEASCFLKHLARHLSVTWECHYGEVIRLLWARLTFTFVQATSVCIRRPRTKWRSLGLEDGAAVPFDWFM